MNYKNLQQKSADAILKYNKLLVNIIIPTILIGFFLIVSISSIERRSNTIDEKFHLVRGVMMLETGDMRLNQHHPFLFNLIPAIPTKFIEDFQVPSTDSELWANADKDKMSVELVEINGGREEFSTEVLYPARVTAIVITSLFFLLIYFMVVRFFGPIPAVVTLGLLTTSPNIIAHSGLVTTDIPAMLTIFITSLIYYKVLKIYKKKEIPMKYLLVLSGATLIMLLSKYTGVFVAILLIGTIFLHDILLAYRSKDKLPRKIWLAFRSILVISLSTILLLTIAYQFQVKPMADMAYANEKKIEADLDNLRNIQENHEFLGTSLEDFYMNVPVPFPQFVEGFYSNVFKHNYYGHSSFFMGEFGGGGWILYFPTSFLIKVPLGTLLALLISSLFGLFYLYKKRPKFKLEYLPLILVPALIILLSLMSSINLGIRHLFPIFPFLFLMIGGVVDNYVTRKNLVPLLIAALLVAAINIHAVLSIHPYHIPYFNQLIGGPSNGFYYVRDSNTDWGQSYLYVEDFISENSDLDITKNPEAFKEHQYLLIAKNSLYTSEKKMTPYLEEIQELIESGDAEIAEEIAYTHYLIKF